MLYAIVAECATTGNPDEFNKELMKSQKGMYTTTNDLLVSPRY